MDILVNWFQKKGIKDVADLSKEEKQTYDNFQRILSKEKLTMEDVQKFLETQIAIIEGKWRDYETADKARLIPYHTIYKAILQAIGAPQAEREQLEHYLTQQLNQL